VLSAEPKKMLQLLIVLIIILVTLPICSPFSGAVLSKKPLSLVTRNALPSFLPFDLSSALTSSVAAGKSSLVQVTLLMCELGEANEKTER
jgi:hypothetical protein